MLDNCYQRETIEAGCDEAGRGCLAGSVFAAAVILPPDFSHPLLNDSKQMTERRRDMLREIIEREAVAWAVSEVTAERIDKINILNASIEAMNAAVARRILKADGRYADIAAASVLAKTHRDEYMRRLDREYPVYGWSKNKGYPTRDHRLAIRRHGLSPYHRLTFNHDIDQQEMF